VVVGVFYTTGRGVATIPGSYRIHGSSPTASQFCPHGINRHVGGAKATVGPFLPPFAKGGRGDLRRGG